MARLFTTGFELGDVIEHDGADSPGFGGFDVSSTYKRTGDYSLKCGVQNNGADIWFSNALDDKNEVYFRVAVYFRNPLAVAPSALPHNFISFTEAGDHQISIGWRSDTSRLYVYRGGTGDMGESGGAVLDTSTAGIRAQQWYLIEGHIVFHGATGTVVVKANNTTVLSFGPGDTITTPNAWADAVRIGCNGMPVGQGHNAYLDDVAINDTVGGEQNSWAGGGGVFLLKPTADGNSHDFTPSAGADNYAMVDDIPANDSDWNYSSTATHMDTFTIEDLPAEIDSVALVENMVQVALAQPGAQIIEGTIRHGGADFTLDAHNITSVSPDWQVEKDELTLPGERSYPIKIGYLRSMTVLVIKNAYNITHNRCD